MQRHKLSHLDSEPGRGAIKRMSRALLAGSAMLLPCAAEAQSISWKGDAGTDWFTVGNWSDGSAIPGSGRSATINAATNQPVIGAGQAAQAFELAVGELTTGSLTVRDGATLEVGAQPGGFPLVVGGVATNGSSAIGAARNARGSLLITGAGSQVIARTLYTGQGADTIGAQDNARAGGTVTIENRGLLRLLNGASIASGVSAGTAPNVLTVTGAGSRFEAAGQITVQQAGSRVEVLNGASVAALAPGLRWDIAIAGGLVIDGPDTIANLGQSANVVTGSAAFENAGLIVQNGATATVGVLAAAGSSPALGSEAGSIILRSGAKVTADQVDLSFSIRRAAMLVDDATLSVSGAITVGNDFASTTSLLQLRNANVTASEINLKATGSQVVIGSLPGVAASGAGSFAVGSMSVGSGNRMVFNHTSPGLAIGSSMSGDGALDHQAGRTVLGGNSPFFSGSTTLTGGTLVVNGQLGSAGHRLSASGGATLGGSGQINGAVSLADAILSAGNSPGTLTFGNSLVLGANSILAFELGAPGGTPGVGSDLITVAGNLTLDGTLNVIDAGGFGAGVYRLINYGGTLTDNGLLPGAVPTGYTAADLTIQTSVARQVNLLVAAPVTSFTFWDGADTSGNGAVDGGTGNWRADRTNWTLASGSRNGVVDPTQLLVFAGAAGTVTVDPAGGVLRAGAGLQFATGGYRLEGGSIALDGPVATMRVGDGTAAGGAMTATVDSVLTGMGRLEKTDLGTLSLTGANTYAAGTRVRGGVLQIATDDALGAAAGSVTLDGGTLRTTSALTSARDIVIDAGGGTLDSGTTALALKGRLSGTGDLLLSGGGARTLSGNSSGFSGATTLAAGTLDLSGTLGGRLVVAAPATLIGTGRVASLDLAGTFSPGAAATATFNVTGDVTIRAGSTFRVDLAANAGTDRIDAGGRAQIDGGNVAITALDPDLSYTNGTIYRIVNAAGGRSGSFAGLTESSAFLDFSLGYDGTGAFLTTTVVAQFPDVAQTANQVQAATALKGLSRVAGSDGLAAYNAIILLGAEPSRETFDAASGEIYPVLLAARQRAGLELVSRFAVRAKASAHDGVSFWGGALADRGYVDGDGNGARITSSGTGLESGLDVRVAGGRLAFGLGGGWQHGEVSVPGRASRAQTDAWHFGGYARYGTGGPGLSTTVSAVHAAADAQVNRQMAIGGSARIASSSVKLTTTAASAELRMGFGSDSLSLGPVTSLDQVWTRSGLLTESGAGALNLAGAAQHENWTRLGLGGFVRHSGGHGFADLVVRYVLRDRGDTGMTLTMSGSPVSLVTRAAGGSRGAMRADVRAETMLGERWALGANLGATKSAREGQIDGHLRLSYRF